jgi:hypothetical protein
MLTATAPLRLTPMQQLQPLMRVFLARDLVR